MNKVAKPFINQRL